MEIKGKVTIPAREEERVLSVKCDICNAEGSPGVWGEVDWKQQVKPPSPYLVQSTTVQCKRGNHYPGSRDIEIETYHICHNCWKFVLAPFLEKQGASPTITEISD